MPNVILEDLDLFIPSSNSSGELGKKPAEFLDPRLRHRRAHLDEAMAESRRVVGAVAYEDAVLLHGGDERLGLHAGIDALDHQEIAVRRIDREMEAENPFGRFLDPRLVPPLRL